MWDLIWEELGEGWSVNIVKMYLCMSEILK